MTDTIQKIANDLDSMSSRWASDRSYMGSPVDDVREIVERLRATLSAQEASGAKLIGWRTDDYLMETADRSQAMNWQSHHRILPIFEGDTLTKLNPAPPTSGGLVMVPSDINWVLDSEFKEQVGERIRATNDHPLAPPVIAVYETRYRWRAVVMAVTKTKSPPAHTPKECRHEWFPDPDLGEGSGYLYCRKCDVTRRAPAEPVSMEVANRIMAEDGEILAEMTDAPKGKLDLQAIDEAIEYFDKRQDCCSEAGRNEEMRLAIELAWLRSTIIAGASLTSSAELSEAAERPVTGRPIDELSAINSQRYLTPSAKPAPADESGADDPGEFGAGIEPNPKARYWQQRAAFWRETAKALGYVPPGEETRGIATGDTATFADVWTKLQPVERSIISIYFTETQPRAAAQDGDTHAFQNFHRMLCERFGYTHDAIEWRRDQVSLMEHIARLTQPAGDLEDAARQGCTCPSGDGSLRWPCPKHPPTTQPRAAAQDAVELLRGFQSTLGAICPDDPDDAATWRRIDSAIARITQPAGDLEDAARYRWLKAGGYEHADDSQPYIAACRIDGWGKYQTMILEDDDADAAIDAARRAREVGK